MCLLTFSFYMLTQHPDIEHRLRQEIFEKVGPTGSPSYEQMREMKYTKAFLNGMNQCTVFHEERKIDTPCRGSQTLSTGVSNSPCQKHISHMSPTILAQSIKGPTTSLLFYLL
jgi:hypothetical protein